MASRNIPEGRAISDSQSEVSGHQSRPTYTPAARATCQEHRVIPKFRPVSQFCVGHQANCRHSCTLVHVEICSNADSLQSKQTSPLCTALCKTCPVRSPNEIWSSFCSPSVCLNPVQTSDRCELVEISKLSQSMSNAMPSKAKMILRVSFQKLCLEDVAILNEIEKISREQSSCQVDFHWWE